MYFWSRSVDDEHQYAQQHSEEEDVELQGASAASGHGAASVFPSRRLPQFGEARAEFVRRWLHFRLQVVRLRRVPWSWSDLAFEQVDSKQNEVAFGFSSSKRSSRRAPPSAAPLPTHPRRPRGPTAASPAPARRRRGARERKMGLMSFWPISRKRPRAAAGGKGAASRRRRTV